MEAKTATKVAKPSLKPVKKAVKTTNTPISHGVGRRKSSVARVWLRKGTGTIVVNGRPFEQYFDTEVSRVAAFASMKAYVPSQYIDVDANVSGGGVNSQADAVKLGIARAIAETSEDARLMLREYGFLTCDSRLKERKKYGQRGARRKFQFVKR